MRWRQKPESARRMMRTAGQAWRSRFTSSARIAQACFAPSILDGRRYDTSSCSPQNTYSGK